MQGTVPAGHARERTVGSISNLLSNASLCRVQTESIVTAEEFAARHIRLVLQSGYDAFSAIYRISVSGGTNLFTTKVDTNFSFGGNTTPASAAPSSSKLSMSSVMSSHEQQQQQRAYSFNNPPPLASAGSRGGSPHESGEEAAGFQSTFRLPSDRGGPRDRGFGKRKQESLATEDGSGREEDPDKDDDDDFVGVGGGVNWQL